MKIKRNCDELLRRRGRLPICEIPTEAKFKEVKRDLAYRYWSQPNL